MAEAVGQLRLMTITTPKSWERYGIHALEAVYPLLEPGGWISVANTGTEQANIVHARHASGVDVVLAAVADMYGAFCQAERLRHHRLAGGGHLKIRSTPSRPNWRRLSITCARASRPCRLPKRWR